MNESGKKQLIKIDWNMHLENIFIHSVFFRSESISIIIRILCKPKNMTKLKMWKQKLSIYFTLQKKFDIFGFLAFLWWLIRSKLRKKIGRGENQTFNVWKNGEKNLNFFSSGFFEKSKLFSLSLFNRVLRWW